MAEKNTGGPSSVHKLPQVSTLVLHIMNDLKNLYEKFNIAVKTQKYRHKYRNKYRNIEINCKLGPVVAFSV